MSDAAVARVAAAQRRRRRRRASRVLFVRFEDSEDMRARGESWTPRARRQVLRFANGRHGWRSLLGRDLVFRDADEEPLLGPRRLCPVVAIRLTRHAGATIDRDVGHIVGVGLSYTRFEASSDKPSLVVLRNENWHKAPAMARAAHQRTYRRYLINHEFGHALGITGHVDRDRVDAEGFPALMAQQTKGTAAPRGCYGAPRAELDGPLLETHRATVELWIQNHAQQQQQQQQRV